MGLFSWLRRTHPEPAPTAAAAAEPSTDAIPMPGSWPTHSRSVAALATEPRPAAGEASSPVQTVRRFFAAMAASNDQVFDRSLAERWEQVSVERYFMSITGPRPTLNRTGQVCSEALGSVDDAFAAFEWD